MRTIFNRISSRVTRTTGLVVAVLITLAIGVSVVWLWRSSRSLAEQAVIQPTEPSSSSVLKIYTDEQGIYELDNANLKPFGIEINPEKRLYLFSRGKEQTFWIEDRDDENVIRFYAGPGRSLYTQSNIYWLVTELGVIKNLGWDNDEEFEESTAIETDDFTLSGLPRTSYAAFHHAEKNLVYSPLVKEGDHWFWMAIPAPGSQDFEFDLSAIESGSVRIRFGFWSNTEARLEPDHMVKIELNGEPILDESWDGKGPWVVEAETPAIVLQEGANRITIENPELEGVLANNLYLDWYEVIYPRKPVAENDRLQIESNGVELKISGFSGPATVYDITDLQEAMSVGSISNPLTVGNGETWQGKAQHKYYLIGPNGYLQPTGITPLALSPDFRRDLGGSDYLAIGPPDLLQPLKPLLDWRTEQGYKVKSIPVEAIYDQFNYGFPEPQAIRDFLKYATRAWNPAPRYLVLVGDASFDPKGYISPAEANRLPTFLVNTDYGGETASDVLFTRLDQAPVTGTQTMQNVWLDVAIGRIPARNPTQVSTLVGKTLDYEQSETPEIAGILAIADGQEATFRNEAQAFLDLFPSDYPLVLFTPDPGTKDANTQIISYFDQGYLLMAYFGHGSVTMWGKDRLFSTEDIPALVTKHRLPVVVNMTCLTGLFTHPKVESLAEALLWHLGGGAVAVLAPTSLTLPNDQSFFSEAFVRNLLGSPDATLGEHVLAARQEVSMDQPEVQDVLLTYLLFGDPALRLMHNK